jgi:hypothetical protein
MNMIFKEERKRQRRIVDAAIANFGADIDVDMELRPATSREMIGRMERRYAELTLAEEGERDQRRSQELGWEGEAGQGEMEMEMELQRQEQAPASAPAPPQQMMQTETQQPPHTRPGERIYGPDIRVPVIPNSTSTFISMSGAAPPGMASGSGSGLSFAERARARARTRETEEDNARKRARLTGPDLGSGDGAGDGDGDGDGDVRFGVSGGGFAGVEDVMPGITESERFGRGARARDGHGGAADAAMYDVPDQRRESYGYDDDNDHDHDHDMTDRERRKRKRDRERERERRGKRTATGIEDDDEGMGQA